MASLISWLLFFAGFALIVATAYLIPSKLKLKTGWYAIFTLGAWLAWFAFAGVCMLFDSKVGNDVPGIGFIVIGVMCWLFGSVVFFVRMLFKY